MRSARARRIVARVAIHVVALAGSAILIIPFIWMVSTSLKPIEEIYIYPPTLFPRVIRWQNYIDALNAAYAPLWVFLRNTLLYMCLPVLVLDVLVNAMVGFAFARVRFRGSQFLFLAALATMMLPSQVTMIPLFILFARLRWVNTYLPIIVPAAFGWPYMIFLMRQFFATIPDELDDAARIDGCGIIGMMWRIHFPLALPALGIAAVFSFTGQWNEFLRPLLYLNRVDLWPLALYLRAMQHLSGTTRWEWLMATAVFLCVPPIVLFFVAQRRYIQGIVITGVKG